MTSAKAEKRLRKAGGRPKKPGPREPNGRLKTPSPREKAEDAQRVAIEARTRQLGQDWFDAYGVTASDPMVGFAVGVQIVRHTGTTQAAGKDAVDVIRQARAKLWAAVGHIVATEARYATLKGLRPRHAQAARILAPVDRLEAGPDHPPPDLRTDAEKAASAEAAWYNTRSILLRMHPTDRAMLERAVLDDDPRGVRWHPVMQGLWMVADWLDGKQKGPARSPAAPKAV